MAKKYRSTAAADSGEPPHADPAFWESRVAADLGVARAKISTLRRRHLAEGDDWRVERNAVVLTPRGLELLKGLLLAKGGTSPAAAPIEAATATEQPPAGPPVRQQVRVARLCANTRLMLCGVVSEPAAPALLVRVKSNENFMPGMVLEVIQAGANQWQFAGRLPRRKGRW